jgi:hypothetical protein
MDTRLNMYADHALVCYNNALGVPVMAEYERLLPFFCTERTEGW